MLDLYHDVIKCPSSDLIKEKVPLVSTTPWLKKKQKHIKNKQKNKQNKKQTDKKKEILSFEDYFSLQN